MTNLLEETISDIKDCGQKIENLIFIGSERTGEFCTWDEFRRLADKNYENNNNLHKVMEDLVIIFEDHSKMRRVGYNLDSWWDYHPAFKIPEKIKKIKTLFV